MNKPWIVDRNSDEDCESVGAVFDLYLDTDPVIPIGRFLDTLAKYDPKTETAETSLAACITVARIAQIPVMLQVLTDMVKNYDEGTWPAWSGDAQMQTLDARRALIDQARAILRAAHVEEVR
jgi:hypothetical protein